MVKKIWLKFKDNNLWLKLRAYDSSRFWSKQTFHSNVLEMHSETMLHRELTPCQNKFISPKLTNDLIEKGDITTRMDVAIDAFINFVHEISTFDKNPPDIYIINEKGRKVQYIMCV